MTLPEDNLPRHIAVIMDGNGRWAKKRGLPRIAGHRSGLKALRKLVEHAVSINLQAMTVFAFSRENWQRPDYEVRLLMELFMSSLQSEVSDLHKHNIRLRFVGQLDAFNQKLLDLIEESESLTAENTGLILNVAINYSGRWDIVQACQQLFDEQGEHAEITEVALSARMSLSDIDEPDLFIRTGGEQRISNYLLWQLAYTELFFSDVLWPDYTAKHFNEALQWFANRERRFGKISEQIKQTNVS